MADNSNHSADERAERYRALAADARRSAAKANGGVRDSYLDIAERWERLAAEAEAETKSGNKSST